MGRGVGEAPSGAPPSTHPQTHQAWAWLLGRSWLVHAGPVPTDDLRTRPRQDPRPGSSSPDGQGGCSVLSSCTPD